MVLMKDISLAKTNTTGQYLYYKVQDILWDDVFSKYMLHPKVCFVLSDYITSMLIIYTGPPNTVMIMK